MSDQESPKKATSSQASNAEQTSLSELENTQKPTTVSPPPGASSPSPPPFQTPSAALGRYWIMAKFGTDYDVFLNFTSNLDNTSGILTPRSDFPEIEKPFYITSMSAATAEELQNNPKYPFISAVMELLQTGENAAEQYAGVIPRTPEAK
ncbi:hypothetical protein BU16DRAFT_605836 [Lophium mytilinum]|uniref:Uncharacterized protein n=1 Tax=Lophium mytilinum TaxID=390894 RepID=A0A6A6QY78_9PEZI|nr:hypothetical protein BU16DRAFT_605836 [Lophium mytilinum]